MAYPNLLSRPIAAALATLGVLTLASGAWAQTTTSTDPGQAPQVNAAEGFGDTESNGGLFGESGSPFDIIHRAVLMNDITMEDFSRQQRGHFDNEAANFRELQQEALQQQSQPQVGSGATSEPGAQ